MSILSSCRQLLRMLMADPAYSYAEISATLHIPVGSIGPQRARCLERLRQSHVLTALGEDDIEVNISGGEPGA